MEKGLTELVQAIAVTAELTGGSLSEPAMEAMARELSNHPRAQALEALRRCARELRYRLTLAEVISRLDDGRPGVEEAWALMPLNEAQTVVWTQEMARAFTLCGPLLDRGDKIGARLVFKEAYDKLVAEARNQGKPVQWSASLGFDKKGRDPVLLEAIERGRLTQEAVKLLGNGAPTNPEIIKKITMETK